MHSLSSVFLFISLNLSHFVNIFFYLLPFSFSPCLRFLYGVESVSGEYLRVWSLSLEHWVRGGNTAWMGSQSILGHHSHTPHGQ